MATKNNHQVFTNTAMFTAAAAAHRINGGEYVKIGSTVAATNSNGYQITIPHPKPANRTIMEKILQGSGEAAATAEDEAFAAEVVTHFRGLTFKLLSGKLLSDFEQNALKLASADELPMTSFNIGVIASLPSIYAKNQIRKSVDERIADCKQDPIASTGQKIEFTAEVVKCVFSYKWNTHYLTAITDTGHAVFFGGGKQEIGAKITATGKVGGLMPGGLNKLSHVKIVGA